MKSKLMSLFMGIGMITNVALADAKSDYKAFGIPIQKDSFGNYIGELETEDKKRIVSCNEYNKFMGSQISRNNAIFNARKKYGFDKMPEKFKTLNINNKDYVCVKLE